MHIADAYCGRKISKILNCVPYKNITNISLIVLDAIMVLRMPLIKMAVLR